MPRYFIDLHDGTQPLKDEVGFDLPDLPAARAKVVRIMSAIARDMLDHGGALVTELNSQTRQYGTAYIARNRIIAALSAGCVIVESPDSGGSLVTARLADEYHRSVMAVPGRVTDRSCAGTNFLIRSRKAQAVLSAEDIIVELGWDLEPEPAGLRPQ